MLIPCQYIHSYHDDCNMTRYPSICRLDNQAERTNRLVIKFLINDNRAVLKAKVVTSVPTAEAVGELAIGSWVFVSANDGRDIRTNCNR